MKGGKRMMLIGCLIILAGFVVLAFGSIYSDEQKRKEKARGPWQTSVYIHWTDRDGRDWIQGPLSWYELPNENGETDDRFVVERLLKTTGNVVLGDMQSTPQKKD